MKSIALIAALLISGLFASNAHAVVQPDGTFVASRCGSPQGDEAQIIETPLQDVCFGTVVGHNGDQAVALRTLEGQRQVFRVTHTDQLLIAFSTGATKAVLQLEAADGATAAMKVIYARDKSIQSAIVYLSGTEYFVPKFETIFNVQRF